MTGSWRGSSRTFLEGVGLSPIRGWVGKLPAKSINSSAVKSSYRGAEPQKVAGVFNSHLKNRSNSIQSRVLRVVHAELYHLTT